MMRKISILIVFLFSIFQAFGQDRNITGTVVDETGAGMPGATVQVKGTTKGTVTDVNGAYAISAAAGSTLQFSYVGYIMQEIVVAESDVINVNLAPDVKNLDEVVVVGYGVQKKSLVTGSIAKVKSDEIVSQPSLRIEQALQGRTSGVVFNQTSGNPGAGVTVRVRGVSSNRNADPLFIIDGMKTSKYVMNEINPNDIESVEVLKDAASAAIYGSEGANGVIIITTKSGTGKKEKAVVSYDGYFGWQQADPVKVMSADQYRDYYREAYAYDKMYSKDPGGLDDLRTLARTINTRLGGGVYGTSASDSIAVIYQNPADLYNYLKETADNALLNGKITQTQYDNFKLNSRVPLTFEGYKKELFDTSLHSPTDLRYNYFKKYIVDTVGKGTDWMKEIFQTAPMQSHHISVQTGTDKSNLYIAASYFTQDGVVGGDKNNFTRYNFRINGDVQAKKWLKLGSNVLIAHTKQRNITVNDPYTGVVAGALAYDPTIPAYWNDTAEIFDYYRAVGQYPTSKVLQDSLINNQLVKSDDGRWFSNTALPVNERINPLANIKLSENDIKTTERILGNVYAEIKPFSFLTYRTSYSGELTYETNDNWGYYYYLNGTSKRDRSYVYQQIIRYYNQQIDNTLTFQKTFGDHGITLMAGQSVQEYLKYGVNGTRVNLPVLSNDFAYLDAVPVPDDSTRISIYGRTNGGPREVSSLIGYFGRLNYDYKEKYLFTATIRRDGSSKFEKNHRFGIFPSFSVGWNINKENFFNVPQVTLLKARASWGRNGNLGSVDAWQWISTKTAQVVGGTSSVITGVVKNPDLTWETSEQINIGIDLGLFRNKLTLSAEWYSKKTIDLLAIPVQAKWTDEVPWKNVGQINNTGIEIELGYAEREKAFKYDAKFTATYLKNEVMEFNAAKLGGYSERAPQDITAFEVGKPVWYFRGYKALGIFQSWEEIRNYTYTDPVTGKVSLIQPDATPGDVKIQDVGGGLDTKTGKMTLPDGKIDANDFTELGKPMPTWTFGLNLGCEFMGFDASMFIYSELDKTIYNNTLRNDLMHLNRQASFYENRWTAANNTNDWMRARFENNDAQSQIGFNSLFFEDASFLRIKNIQLGYTLPASLTEKIDVSKFRVYVSATNLYTLTGYSGMDPEIGVTQGDNSYGVDRGMYPSAKQYIIGVNLTF